LTSVSPIATHREETKRLAKALSAIDVYKWIMDSGYFPEQYVLPPCFAVAKRPAKPRSYTKATKGKAAKFKVKWTRPVSVHFPKSELTDRTFGIIHPEIHNDIAYLIYRNWKKLVDRMIPRDSVVTSYAFPIPIDKKHPGRMGYLRSGRMIYEFIAMTDDDLAAVAYKYSYIVRADIKNFYPSIYTHSLAWAIHGKAFIRRGSNRNDSKLVGNRLDKLFQGANDGCTNGVPIGPVVSDIAAELVASAVDRLLSNRIRKEGIICEAVRFKDDYRILTRTEGDARTIVKALQSSLKEYNLELSEDKTTISTLPDGLFRPWKSRYHAAHPRSRKSYTCKEFRELYLAVISIDKDLPGTGVIDTFLANITSRKGDLKMWIGSHNLEKVISMLLLLANRRVKSFPKILAILESVLKSPFGVHKRAEILEYLEKYLAALSTNEERNKYLVSWICYFIVSNGLKSQMKVKPKLKDPITRSIFNSRGLIFKECKDFKLFIGCRAAGKKLSMIEHLEVFHAPRVV